MNVVVLINGREAIPVRAIPLLTNWASMSPDIVARVLAADEDIFGFEGLQAYHLEGGLPRQILPAWWQKSCVRELKALSERLESTHAGHETQHAQWRDESLLLLPAGAFVWKDEYTTLHDSNWASRLREKRHTAWFLNRCADRNEEIDDAEEPSFMQKIAIRRVDEEFEAWRTLDFSPFIPSINRKNSVMEGFAPNGSESNKAAPNSAAAVPTPEWSIKKPLRYLGYTAPLHAQLNAAHREGKPCPTAREVLEAWRINKPAEIVQVLADGFNHYDSEGNTKAVYLAALRGAINRATSAR